MVKALRGVSLVGLAMLSCSVHAQPQHSERALVIRGATLIDGNGGPPIPDAVVVIQGDRFVAAGSRADVKQPSGAKVINAAGKYIVPGLIDAKSNYTSAYGEAYVNWGVTTAVVTGGGMGDPSVAERDAINHGLLTGPRLILSYSTLTGPGADGKRQDDGMPGRNGFVGHSPAEARHIAQQFLTAGADILSANDGDGSPEIYRAFVEEAHKAGVSTAMRAIGPGTLAREAALMGADVLIHTGNAGNQIALDPQKWAKSTIFSPDAYADMDPAKATAMIALLIEHGVALEPDMMAADRGFSKNWARVQAEAATFYDAPGLRSYVSRQVVQGLQENVKSPDTYLDSDALDQRARGFRNHVAFLKQFVDAGGHIVAASDVPQTPAGFGLLQELAVFEEDIGLTPMQALQAGTKWTADAFKLRDLGVIAAGKYASLVIVDDDPTKTVLNLRKISQVVKEGRIVDRRYHADYLAGTFKTGLLREGGYSFGSPAVEGMRKTAQVKQATWNAKPPRNAGFGGQAGGFDSKLDATPGIESIFPYTVPQGSAATEMTIRGFNFSSGSELLVDGKVVRAKVVDRQTIQAVLDASIFAKAGRFYVMVRNNGALTTPEWGDTSNAATLTVPYPFTTKFSRNRF